jgi:hypothetical protein
MRRSASHEPRAAPCVSTASSAYAEHVGVKRHLGANERDTRFL